MKIIDYINNAYVNLIRNKKNIFFSIILILLTIFIMITITFKKNFLNYINDTLIKNLGFRTLSVSPDLDSKDYGYSKLLSITNVIDVHSSKYDYVSVESDFKNNDYDGIIELNYGNKNIIPANIVGSVFDDNDTGVAICPINFYPSSEAFNLFLDDNLILNGYNMLNKEFEITYYSYLFNGKEVEPNEKFNKSFKIIGLYNSNETMIPANTCYISKRDIEEIKNVSNTSDENTISGFMVVVDNINNIDLVIEEVEKLGFASVSVRNELDINTVNIILLSCNIIIAIVVLSVIFLTIYYVNKKFIHDRKDIGIMRTLGYNKKTTILLSLFNLSVINSIAYFIGLVLFSIIYIICKESIFKSLIYSGFIIKIPIQSYIVSFCIIELFTLCIGIFFVLKLFNKNLIELIRSEEV